MARYKSGPHSTAQTDTVVVSVASGFAFVVTGYYFTLKASCTVPYAGFTLEFDDTADIPFGGHDAIRPGSGSGEKQPSPYTPLAEGADGQDILLTCDVPTGGTCTLWLNGDLVATA